MRIIDWSSDVCFSDLSFRASTRRPGGHLGVGECARTLIIPGVATPAQLIPGVVGVAPALRGTGGEKAVEYGLERQRLERLGQQWQAGFVHRAADGVAAVGAEDQRRSRAEAPRQPRTEAHTSEPQSLIRIFNALLI